MKAQKAGKSAIEIINGIVDTIVLKILLLTLAIKAALQ